MFNGCAGGSPEPIKAMPLIKTAKSGNELIRFSSDIGTGSTQNAELENTAILLYEAASQYKQDGIDYFFIANKKKKQLLSIITNFKDLERYCFPEVEGLTTLEDKCFLSAGNDVVKLSFFGVTKQRLSQSIYYWSAEQVLNDPLVHKYRNSALKDFDDKTISFEEVKRIRHLN